MKVETKRKTIIFIAGIFFILILFPSLFNFHENTRGEQFTASSLSDIKPPVTTKEYGNPFYTDWRGEWISPSTKIWMNATDDDSGVHYTHYEVWRDSDGNGTFETMEKNVTVYDNDYPNDLDNTSGVISTYFTLSNSCHHEITFYSVDYESNVETYLPTILQEEWNYSFQPKATYFVDEGRMVFGSSPAIANLCINEKGEEPDEYLEVVCGSDEYGNYYPALGYHSSDGIWRCFDSGGEVEWATPTKTDQARSSPAIADIDGNGKFEIAGGTTSGWFLEVMECNGSMIWTFPKAADGIHIGGGRHVFHSSPAVVDVLNGSGLEGLEVIIGDNPNGKVWCFDGNNSDGTNQGFVFQEDDFPHFPLWRLGMGGTEGIDWDPIWMFDASGRIIASPAVGDVDDDGFLEIAIGSLDGGIYVLNASTGESEWNYATGASVFSSAAIANLDSDSPLEIVVGSNDTYLYCLDGGGGLQWMYKTDGAVYSSPAIGDADGDDELEIVFGSLDSYVYCIDSDGNLEWKYKTNGPIYSSPALAKTGSVIPYQMDWPMFRHDVNRTGFYGNATGPLGVFIGSNDWNLYWIDGRDGTLIDSFTTYGPIRTSPSISDIDGDSSLEILFYDWGNELVTSVPNATDTFWCLGYTPYKEVNHVYVDVDPPVLEKEVGNPKCAVEDDYCITTSTDITIGGYDVGCNEGSGVERIEYRVWWNGVWSDWTQLSPGSTIHLTQQCTHYLEIRLIDNTGNILVDNETFRVDDDAPAIIKIIGDPNITIIPGEEYDVTTDTPITIDVDSGCCNYLTIVQYNNGSGWVEITDTLPFTHYFESECHHWLNITATDCFGRNSYDNETFHVNHAPEISITKLDTPDPVQAGGTLTYILTVQNIGNENATNVVVTEVYDANVMYSGATPSPTYGDNVWIFPTLNVSESKTITVTVTVNSPLPNGTLLHNYVNATCDEGIFSETWENTIVGSAPEISIMKSDNPDPVQAGGTLVYILTVQNIGSDNATNVIVTETYDANVTYVGATPSPTYGDNVWIFPTLNVSESKTITITVAVNSPLPNGTILANYVNVTSGEGIFNQTWENTITVSPILHITKTDGRETIPAGCNDTYIIIIKNAGYTDATNVIITDVLPSNTTYLSAAPLPTSTAGQTLAWNIGTLKSLHYKLISIKVRVHSPLPNGTLLHNYVNITCDEEVKNDTYDDTTVISQPLLSIEKSDSPDPVESGDMLTYTLWINNTGNSNATNVNVTESYDDNVTFISSIPSPSYGVATWIFPALNVSESRIINITVGVHPDLPNGTLLHNYVHVTCDERVENNTYENTTVFSPPSTYKEFFGTIYYDENGSEYIADTTIIYLATTENVTETYYRIFMWNPSNETFILLFDWMTIEEGEMHDPPFYPINLCDIGMYFNLTCCGFYEIEYYSIDIHNNVESIKWNDVCVDCSPPISTKEYGDPNIPDNWGPETVHWITSDTFVHINASEGCCGSGVKEIWYKVYYPDGTLYTAPDPSRDNWTLYEEPFSIDGPDGIYSIYYKAIDNVGHVEHERKQKAILDNSPPTTTIEFGEPHHTNETGERIALITSIYLNATDQLLPTNYTINALVHYRIYHTGQWTEWFHSWDKINFTLLDMNFLDDGHYYIEFYSEDKLGNKESLNNCTLYVSSLSLKKGDFDDDGDIDFNDFISFADAYGSVLGDPNYDVRGDFDDDGDIDFNDFISFADAYEG